MSRLDAAILNCFWNGSLELFFSPTFTLIIFRFYFQKNQNRRMNPKGKKTHICKRKTWYGWYYITELYTKKKVWNNRDMPLKCMPLFTFTIRLRQDRDPESTKFNGQLFCLPQKDRSPFWEKRTPEMFLHHFQTAWCCHSFLYIFLQYPS